MNALIYFLLSFPVPSQMGRSWHRKGQVLEFAGFLIISLVDKKKYASQDTMN